MLGIYVKLLDEIPDTFMRSNYLMSFMDRGTKKAVRPGSTIQPPNVSATSFTIPSPTVLEDFFEFCKKVGSKELETIIKEGQLVHCGPGSIVYSQGDPSDSFYVINDGTVEIVLLNEHGEHPTPITHLTKGDLFGEIGLLTNTPRDASVSVHEAATLLRFDQNIFQQLITTVPSFGHYLALLLARRFCKATMQLHFYSNAKELSGSLDFFDLPTIFQTISLSQQHGIMHIFNLTAEIIGEFAFSYGTPVSARYQQLEGIEALLQLFQVTPKANFGFTRSNEPPVVDSPLEIDNINEFIVHAVHLRDEMMVLEEKLKLSDDQPVKRIHTRLEWPYSDFQMCAKELWRALMKGPLPLSALSITLPYCRFRILQVMDRLFETGQLAFAKITPYGYR